MVGKANQTAGSLNIRLLKSNISVWYAAILRSFVLL
jgi:hypothetical protein